MLIPSYVEVTVEVTVEKLVGGSPPPYPFRVELKSRKFSKILAGFSGYFYRNDKYKEHFKRHLKCVSHVPCE